MVKKPRSKLIPHIGKSPRHQKQPQSSDSETIVWHVNTIDKEGEWGWKKLEVGTFWDVIFEAIKHFETMTWSVIKGSQNHTINVADICKEAQKRLRDIQLDDIDELFSLRISGAKRIFGIRDGRVFKVLWWDPNHTVCPTKRNYHKY